MTISQAEWDELPQEEKNRRIHEFKRSLWHILEGHGKEGKEVVIAALKSILEDHNLTILMIIVGILIGRGINEGENGGTKGR